MRRRPQSDEAAPYYFTYIDKVTGDDPVRSLEAQLDQSGPFFKQISEEKSLHRYAPGKWSIRESLNHINDAERLFAFRAMWFARGFELPLPSFDQTIAVRHAEADRTAWAAHIEEFCRVRSSTLSLLQNLPEEAWGRVGIASDNRFTVRALAFIIAGHLNHHIGVLRERYL
ncbi:MAG: DinB family protein [Acidobacteria bacterium]|nr:DinB family protein [Acidobacteriota bacterium]